MSGRAALKDRIILITGASGALGSVIAKACAREGATVVLLGRSIPKLEKLYDDITASGGPTPALYPLDLAGASEQDYRDLAATLKQQLGGLHGLVHCAAELGHLVPLTDLTGERWQRLLHVNLTAPFMLTRELTTLMMASGQASIVFVGDSAVGDGKAYWGAYGVAKIALGGYVRILADETENFGLCATLFTPGPMRSPIRLRAYPAENRETLPDPAIHAATIVHRLALDTVFTPT